LQRFVATISHFTGELKLESQSGAEVKRHGQKVLDLMARLLYKAAAPEGE
jgi:hypothetical protein